MIFTVYADEVLIFHSQSPDEKMKLIDPKLTMEVNAAGSFSFKLPTTNIGYSLIKRLETVIKVFRNDKQIFEGRVIEESEDFWKNKSITCEGALAYLNDTSQVPSEFHDITPRNFLTTMLSRHNAKVPNTGKYGYRITFDNRSYLETGSDLLRIYYKNDTTGMYDYVRCTGNSFGSNFNVYIPASSEGKFWLYFTTDASASTWGFAIIDVEMYVMPEFTEIYGSAQRPPLYQEHDDGFINCDFTELTTIKENNYGPNIARLYEIDNAPYRTVPNRTFDTTNFICTVTDPNNSIFRYTNFESTLECIQDKLVDRLGGYLVPRYENGARIIDYLAEPVNTNSQDIEFGENLLDFSKSWDIEDFVTVIIPQGARLEDTHPKDPTTGEDIEALDAYTDVKSVNSGSIYVYNEEMVERYGWIEAVVRWDDVTVPANLLAKAQAYLRDVQFEKMVLEVNAVDLSYTGDALETFELFDRVRCKSAPHDMDRYFTITKIEIPLLDPMNTTFTLGDNTVKSSLTAGLKNDNKLIKQDIDRVPAASSLEDLVQESWDDMNNILNAKTNGYITITTEGLAENMHTENLVISDRKIDDNPTKKWQFGLNGFGFYEWNATYNRWDLRNIAATMNGEFNANVITTGIIKDKYNLNYWNLDSGAFRLAAGATTIADDSMSWSTYEDNHVPTRNNWPAVNWTSKAVRAEHVGEIYKDLNTNKRYYWRATGTVGYRITFDKRSELESNYDFLYVVYRKENGTYGYVTCTGTSFGTNYVVTIPAFDNYVDTDSGVAFWLLFTTDSSISRWGFKVISVDTYDGDTFTTESGTWGTFPSITSSKNYYFTTATNISETNYEANINCAISIKNAPEVDHWEELVETLKGWADYKSALESKKDYTDLDIQLQQDGIFNRLTSNGTVRGLFMQADDNNTMQLYINADYIATGILKSNDSSSDPNFYLNLNNGQLNAKTLDIITPTLIFSSTDRNIISKSTYTQGSIEYEKNTTINSGNIVNQQIKVSENKIIKKIELTEGGMKLYHNDYYCGNVSGSALNSNAKTVSVYGENNILLSSNNEAKLISDTDRVYIQAQTNIALHPVRHMVIDNNECPDLTEVHVKLSNGNTGYLKFIKGLLVEYSD